MRPRPRSSVEIRLPRIHTASEHRLFSRFLARYVDGFWWRERLSSPFTPGRHSLRHHLRPRCSDVLAPQVPQAAPARKSLPRLRDDDPGQHRGWFGSPRGVAPGPASAPTYQMSVPAVSLGIVGCGMVVERGHLPALAGMKGIRLAAVADPIRARRQIAGGVAGYAQLEEMLAAAQLDAVLICSPPALHLQHAESCAAAGVRTLVEKPPGLTLEHARKLAALRPEPTIGFNRRFAGGLPVGASGVDSPSRVTAIFDAPPGDWDRGVAAADPLLDLGSHLVDLCCWITGTRPARARSIPSSAGRVRFEIEMTDGLRLYGACGAASAYRELLDVRGEQGGARTWRWPEPAPRQAAERLARRPPALIGSWRAQLRAFASAVRGADSGRLALAREAVQVMAALEAVRTSAAVSQRWVTICADPLR
jgi:predicted dehydrogenase